MDQYLYITFHVTADAMATEFSCKENHIEGKLVPVPRVLSSGCGMAWRGRPEDKDITEKLLEENFIEWEQIKII